MHAFTDCMSGYDHEHNVHTSNITGTWKSVHGIDSSKSKLFEFANLSVIFSPCAWMILSSSTSCEGLKSWKLSTVHSCYQPVTIENYFSSTHIRPLWFKKIRKTTTTAFLISNTIVPHPLQPYSIQSSVFCTFILSSRTV